MVRQPFGYKRPFCCVSPRHRRALRGAALLYALVAVLIISIIILGVGRLVGQHFQLEETAQGYSRALYLAEAAANWQLNRMSRCDLDGDHSPPPGRIDFDTIANTNSHYFSETSDALRSDELNAPAGNMPGSVEVWTQNIDITSDWKPGQDFDLYAVGTDAATGIKRAISFRGQGTGLAERYVLFGQKSIKFAKDPDDTTGFCTLLSGYIGTNGQLSLLQGANAPQAKTPAEGGEFGGCRLGPNAGVSGPNNNAWVSDWDMPRLPDQIAWPTINDILAYRYPGAPPSSNNDNGVHIKVRMADGSYVAAAGDTTVLDDSLGASPNPLNQSDYKDSNGNPQHTVLLEAEGGNDHNNVFYFKNIQMQPNDVLILDLRPQTPPHGMTIVIDNPNLAQNVHITNLAYWQSTDTSGLVQTPLPSFYWFNNTNMPLEFTPSLQYDASAPIDQGGTPISQGGTGTWQYTLSPDGSNLTIEGVVYGITDTAGSRAGDVVVDGNKDLKVAVNCIVANDIQLTGRLKVIQRNLIEDRTIPNRYIIYYRVVTNYLEPPANNVEVLAPNSPQYNYGKLQ
jgi:hypothetical protein